jgi:hypothetical protein
VPLDVISKLSNASESNSVNSAKTPAKEPAKKEINLLMELGCFILFFSFLHILLPCH